MNKIKKSFDFDNLVIGQNTKKHHKQKTDRGNNSIKKQETNKISKKGLPSISLASEKDVLNPLNISIDHRITNSFSKNNTLDSQLGSNILSVSKKQYNIRVSILDDVSSNTFNNFNILDY